MSSTNIDFACPIYARTHFKDEEVEAPKFNVFPKSKLVKKPGIELGSLSLKRAMALPRVSIVAWFPVAQGQVSCHTPSL